MLKSIHLQYKRNAWVLIQGPARDIAASILQISPRDAPVPSPSTPTRDALHSRASKSEPHSKVSNTCERRHGPERPDASIPQVPANDTQGTKIFVNVHISKPPDPNANEVATRRSARLDQE